MTMSRRRLLLSLAGIVALGGRFAPARAEVDLLKTPARMSALAPHVMLLGIAIAGERLVAVGERGVVVWSDDEGTTWSQAKVPVSVTLTAVAFADARSGWAVGHDGAVLHSADGGQQWSLQFDGNGANAAVLAAQKATVQAARSTEERQRAEAALAEFEENAQFGPSRPLLDVYVADAMQGWVVGAFGQVFGTRDGGRTWSYAGDALPNPDGLHCNRISRLPDKSLVIAAEAGKVFRTRDEGHSWQVHDTGYAGHLYGILAGGPAGALIAYGFAGNILRSEDDGLNWRQLPVLTSTSLIGGLRLASGRLLLVDRARRVLASDDAGKTWRVLMSEQGRALGGIGPRLVKDRLPVVGAGGVAWLPLKGRD